MNVHGDNWRLLYEECNEHLREQDRKRDQTIAFFVALTGYFVAKESILSDNSSSWILYLLLFVVGIIITFILVRYKTWHEKYVLASISISTVMFSNHEFSIEEFNKIYIETQNKKHISFKNVFWSSESLILNFYLLMNGLNLYFVLSHLFYTFYFILLFLVLIVIYLIFFNIFIYNSMKMTYSSKDSNDIWILRIWR